MQGHKHEVTWNGYHGCAGGSYTCTSRSFTSSDPLQKFIVSNPITDGENGAPRIGNETRTKNITLKLWKRVG